MNSGDIQTNFLTKSRIQVNQVIKAHVSLYCTYSQKCYEASGNLFEQYLFVIFVLSIYKTDVSPFLMNLLKRKILKNAVFIAKIISFKIIIIVL